MNPQADISHILGRLYVLEERLGDCVSRVEKIATDMERKWELYSTAHGRINELENFKKNVTYSLGVLYTAVIGTVISVVGKLYGNH